MIFPAVLFPCFLGTLPLRSSGPHSSREDGTNLIQPSPASWREKVESNSSHLREKNEARRIAMEEYRESTEREQLEKSSSPSSSPWLMLAAGTSIVAACLAIGYGYHQQALVSQLNGQQERMSATVAQLDGQIETLTGKLNEVSAAQQAARAQANSPAAKRAAGTRSSVESKRLKELQGRMEEQ